MSRLFLFISRQIVGWQIEETREEKLVTEALKKVIQRRKPDACLIVHSDGGRQYASNELRQILQSCEYRQLRSRAGETYDNAFAESLFSRYKAELLEGGAFANVEEAQIESFDDMESYYNIERRHSALGSLSPSNMRKSITPSSRKL